ncbi:MAG: UPF0182 family protein [Anaerolineae bacterium]
MTNNVQLSREGTLRLIGIILAVLVVCVFSPAFARFYTEYLWFQSLEFESIFLTRVTASIVITLVAVVIGLLFLILNWSLLPHWIAPKARLTGQMPFNTRGRSRSSQTIDISTRPIRLAFTLGAVIVAIAIGLSFRDDWRTYLLAAEGVPFDLEDPIFGLDVGFYIFRLPWYETLLSGVQALVAVAFIGTFLRYASFGQLKTRGVTAHLSLLGSLWVTLMGIGRLLSRYGLLQSEFGVVFGPGYADVHARMPLYTIQAVLFFAAAIALIVNVFTRQWKILVVIGLVWVAVTLIGPLFPAVVQQFTVEPNEFTLERPYIENNIEFTRRGFDLHTIEEREYPASGTLSLDIVNEYRDVLDNVRLWDYRPLKRTYSQLQEIRLYYSFTEVDIDRYVLDGKLTEVMLAARELDVDEVAEQAQTWINRHLVFTHGYGLTLNSVNEVTPQGLPNLLVRDIPPVAEDPALALSRPEIYFGERTHQYVIVNTSEQEFDYPQGDANVYTRYEGPDGVPLGSAFRRTLLATRFSSVQLLLSSALSSESRILFHRLISDRAQTIAPMLWLDPDPYPVIVEGRIFWLMDAYTWTDHFPYSEPIGDVNYLRNSVKITIDAYTGETRFYLVDPDDPIAATYDRIFPDLFQSAPMPEELQAHWRYPETLFIYQSQHYMTYHMRDPQVFYNREDLWAIPQELVETEQTAMEPYYVALRLPDGNGSDRDQVEFMLVRPYVPEQKQNMVAWLYGHSDGENYGELGVFKLSKERLVFGPQQIEGRVDQDAVISQQLSLWNQRGSRVLRGNMLVIPLRGTFIYVEPLYLESESGQLPELKRVIVAYGDRIAMAPTLQASLMQVFSDVPTEEIEPTVPAEEQSLESLADQAWQHYQAAQACLAEGNWACYGAAQERLRSVLELMVGE